MAIRTAKAVWEGNLKEGKGRMSVGSGLFEGAYSFGSRFEEAKGTNPEELIGAALAGCFSMALSGDLERAGFNPQRIETQARVRLEKAGEGFTIAAVELETRGNVPGIEEKRFQEIAQTSLENCPVSRAVRGPEKGVQARLER